MSLAKESDSLTLLTEMLAKIHVFHLVTVHLVSPFQKAKAHNEASKL